MTARGALQRRGELSSAAGRVVGEKFDGAGRTTTGGELSSAGGRVVGEKFDGAGRTTTGGGRTEQRSGACSRREV